MHSDSQARQTTKQPKNTAVLKGVILGFPIGQETHMLFRYAPRPKPHHFRKGWESELWYKWHQHYKKNHHLQSPHLRSALCTTYFFWSVHVSNPLFTHPTISTHWWTDLYKAKKGGYILHRGVCVCGWVWMRVSPLPIHHILQSIFNPKPVTILSFSPINDKIRIR